MLIFTAILAIGFVSKGLTRLCVFKPMLVYPHLSMVQQIKSAAKLYPEYGLAYYTNTQ